MPRAWAVLSKCMRPNESGATNEFYFWIDKLDWVDSWYTFINSRWEKSTRWWERPVYSFSFSEKEIADLKHDSFMWWITFWYAKPWVNSKVLDIDKDSYHIARNNDWTVKKDADWNAIYIYDETWEEVDWSTIQNKKEKVLWFFNRDTTRMTSAPSWYFQVKTAMLRYVDRLKDTHWNLMTVGWFDMLQRDIQNFFNNIENWKWKKWWYNIIYTLFDSPLWNHWYLISQIMPSFDRMISDREVANNLLWYDFSEVSYREFQEVVAVYSNKARWWNFTVVDSLWKDYADRIYWKIAYKLFWEDESWKMVRLDKAEEWTISKSYLMKLSIPQQIEQVRFMLWKDAPNINKFRQYLRIKLRYDWWWKILRWINFIGKPAVYSFLMSVWKWLTWFMPLLILNSWMFVTDSIAAWHRLNWDWKSLFKKWWMDDWLPQDIEWYSSWIWNTISDIARWAYQKWMDALNQWLFNAWDLLMANSYKVRQYQLFFEAQFPWIRNVWEIDRILTDMAKRDPDQVNRLINAANQYSEYAIRLSTTNTPILASLVRVHAAKNPINQPMLDTFYVMWNFFSGWWFNKISWAIKILKDWLWNVLHWRIWAQYVDELLSVERMSDPTAMESAVQDIRWMMMRSYLENEQLIYTMHKIYISFMIWKYLDRLTEDSWEKNDQNVFDDFSDMLSYMDVFSWEYAALTATPQWRMVKNFWDMFVWEIENNQSLWTATKAATASAAKELFRSMFRKLYIPQITTEYLTLQNANWDTEEWARLWHLKKAIQDNVNWYLFYLKDTTENWEYDYYIPKWPHAYVNSILWKSQENIEFVNNQKTLSRLWNLSGSPFDDDSTFHNWIIYGFPFFKQYNMSKIPDVKWFVDDYDNFRSTREYQQMVDWEFPSDMEWQDWQYIYDITVRRLRNNKEDIRDVDFLTSYAFETNEWWIAYDKNRQSQEYFINMLMNNWLSEEQAIELSTRMNWKTNGYDEEAIRTLAYMEAKTPGSSLQAVAYLMNRDWFDYVKDTWAFYKNSAYTEDQKGTIMLKWKIYAAQKYSKYLPYIDRYYIWPQFILHYAKTHDTPLAKYIDWPGENNQAAMKLITPWSGEDENWITYQNSMLKQNFQAQLMVDIEWANWNPNARKLMNWFALIFDMKRYENADWSIDSKYAAYALDQIEIVYNHINSLAMDENDKRVLKQWALMFWDKLLPNIIKDEELMKREDVQEVVKDWTTYRYWEFRELDQIAIEAAEDQLSNSERKSYWAKRDYLTSWINKKFSWFTNRYNYMKNRAYSSTYNNYRVFDRTPRGSQQSYLSRYDYNQAMMYSWWWTSPQSKPSSRWWWNNDDWIWVSSRRWKSIQFYKREDPDKPVEYRLPRRKRWVKRWSWVKPISTTTWKHLTPKPKINGK